MGVTNGVLKFQRAADRVVEVEGLEGTFPYMGNVTVCGINQKDHDENVARFRDAAKKYNLTLNESKTVSSTTAIKILGYCVSYSLIKPDPDQLQALMELPLLSSCKSLQRIIGLFAYSSKWMLKFSEKIKPLSDCKEFPIEGALTAFENLKKELGEVALQNIDEDNPFVVKCDISEVAFMSREFEMHELHYSSVEKEATAIIESAQKMGTFTTV